MQKKTKQVSQQTKKEKLLDKVDYIFREKMTDRQFEEFAFNWIGMERIAELFFESWNNTEHTEKELREVVKEYGK